MESAVVHAGWNAIAHGISDQGVAFTLMGIGGALCSVPLVLYAPLPRAECQPYLAASVVIHIAYLRCLTANVLRLVEIFDQQIRLFILKLRRKRMNRRSSVDAILKVLTIRIITRAEGR